MVYPKGLKVTPRLPNGSRYFHPLQPQDLARWAADPETPAVKKVKVPEVETSLLKLEGDLASRQATSHEVSNEKRAPGWLGYIGGDTTQLYRDYNKPL